MSVFLEPGGRVTAQTGWMPRLICVFAGVHENLFCFNAMGESFQD